MIIIYTNCAKKDLASLDKDTQRKVVDKINKYAENPSSIDFKKLKGYNNRYRIRQGDYRIVCNLNNDCETEILRIEHRKKVYRDL